jgi:hypothetical protein
MDNDDVTSNGHAVDEIEVTMARNMLFVGTKYVRNAQKLFIAADGITRR